MRIVVKAIVAAVVFLAVYFFSFWVIFAQVIPDNMPWLMMGGALAAATAAAWWAWRKTGAAEHGVLATAVTWALVLGAIGFCVGFFGPLIFAPDANQGPLLGIFITGPLGFVLGGVAGLVYALWRKRKAQAA